MTPLDNAGAPPAPLNRKQRNKLKMQARRQLRASESSPRSASAPDGAAGPTQPSAELLYRAALRQKEVADRAGARRRYEAALKIDPDNIHALTNLSNIYCDEMRFDEAIALGRRATEIEPRISIIWSNLSQCYWRKGDLDAAEDCANRALRAEAAPPRFAWHAAGKIAYMRGRLKDAAACLAKGLESAPEDKELRIDAAMVVLASGNYQEGLQLYEVRWQRKMPSLYMDCGIPLWQGQPLEGKTVLVYGEEGLGDVIQFARFVPRLKQLGAAETILAVPRECMRLFEHSNLADRVVEAEVDVPAAHYRISVVTLVWRLGITLETAGPEPYLVPAPGAAPLPPHPLFSGDGPAPKLKVGLVWAGGHEQLITHHEKSLPLAALHPLLELPGVAFYSIQKGRTREAELAGDAVARERIVDLAPLIHDFADTATMVDQLDLVISACTSPAHLSGGLGIPTWIMSPYARCWRWLRDGRETTPWYDAVRLFTQPAPNDWASVVAAVKARLEQVLAAPEDSEAGGRPEFLRSPEGEAERGPQI